jgi:hypothetical protein
MPPIWMVSGESTTHNVSTGMWVLMLGTTLGTNQKQTLDYVFDIIIFYHPKGEVVELDGS